MLAIPCVSWVEEIGLFSKLPAHSVYIDYAVFILLFAIIFYAVFPALARWSRKLTASIDERLETVRIQDLVVSILGLILGLLLAMLISSAYKMIPNEWITLALSIPTYMLLGYMGFMIPFRRREEIHNIFDRMGRQRNQDLKDLKELATKKTIKKKEYTSPKLLDTSVIIDGRVSDLVQTGFLEGTLIVPVYVLTELQTLSDSADDLKRNKGRRGLDILSGMQQEKKNNIVILDEDYDDLSEVDAKLVKMAKAKGWKILTNDYNLNKVATVQGIAVLNINELANAVKPVVMPGEHMRLTLIKAGKEDEQAIGYLEDGTMIVVENARDHIGKEVDVTVTSVLQTSAGRMIFAKLKEGSNRENKREKRNARHRRGEKIA